MTSSEASAEDLSRFIPPPPDDATPIWRYTDFTKFVALLESRSLFFGRASILEDPFEGSFPPAQSVLERVKGALAVGSIPAGADIYLQPDILDVWKNMRYWAMVSCWHMSPHESAAMWRLYASSTAAVAIRSTVGRLRKALGRGPAPPTGFGGTDCVHLGMIEYIDFATQRIPDGSFAAQFFRKRKSFEHEHELRALILQFPRTPDGKGVDQQRRPDDDGLQVPVDLDVLIEDIFVAPQATQWYARLVTRVAAKYGLTVVPKQSELDATPLY